MRSAFAIKSLAGLAGGAERVKRIADLWRDVLRAEVASTRASAR